MTSEKRLERGRRGALLVSVGSVAGQGSSQCSRPKARPAQSGRGPAGSWSGRSRVRDAAAEGDWGRSRGPPRAQAAPPRASQSGFEQNPDVTHFAFQQTHGLLCWARLGRDPLGGLCRSADGRRWWLRAAWRQSRRWGGVSKAGFPARLGVGGRGREEGGRDDAKAFGLSSRKFSRTPQRALSTSFNCPRRPVAEVKAEAEGRGSALLLALGLRGRAAHTGYSITLYLAALLACVISSLSPVWREDSRCDGLTQDAGGPMTPVKLASLPGWASPPSAIPAAPPTAWHAEAAWSLAFQEEGVQPERG